MNFIEQIKSASLIEPLGWTILHSLWQGLAIALLAEVALRIARARSPQARYLIACGALLSMLIAAGLTFAHLRTAVLPPSSMAVTTQSPSLIPVGPPNQIDVSIEPSHSAPPPTLADRIRPILPSLALAWVVGVLLLGVYHAGGWMVLRRLRGRSLPISDARCRTALADLLTAMRISRPVQLCESAIIQVPTVIGWLWPIILLPASAIVGLTPLELRGLLAHELAHIRRHDYLVNLIQTIIETLLFYHPAVWWLGRVIRQERENCCDDVAAAVCEPAVYAKALATMETLRQGPQLALSARGGALLPRIRRILGVPDSSNRRSMSSGIVSAAILVAIIAGGIALNACRTNAKESTTQSSQSTARVLQGRITDAATGKAVPDVIVSIYGGIGTRPLVGVATTDADGRYHFDDPRGALISPTSSGQWDDYVGIQIQHPTLCSADGQSWWDVTIPHDARTFTKDFKLVPGGKLYGTVNNQAGQGDANVPLRIYTKDNHFFVYATTDARGQFVSAPLFPGDYVIDVNSADPWYPRLATAQVRPGENSPIEVRYDPPIPAATTAPTSQASVEELRQKLEITRNGIQTTQSKLRDLEAQSDQPAIKEQREHLDDVLKNLEKNQDQLQVALAMALHEVFPAPAAATATTAPSIAPSTDVTRVQLSQTRSELAKREADLMQMQNELDKYSPKLLKQENLVAQTQAALAALEARYPTQHSAAGSPTSQPDAAMVDGEYYVSGVPRPGVYSLSGTRRITILQAIISAGGVEQVIHGQVVLIRRDKSRKTFQISDVVNGKDGETILQPDDILMVTAPRVGEYYISGDVPRAGVYSCTGRAIDPLQALIAAGTDPMAMPNEEISIRRKSLDGDMIFRCTVQQIIDDAATRVTLEPGDVVEVQKPKPSEEPPRHIWLPVTTTKPTTAPSTQPAK